MIHLALDIAAAVLLASIAMFITVTAWYNQLLFKLGPILVGVSLGFIAFGKIMGWPV